MNRLLQGAIEEIRLVPLLVTLAAIYFAFLISSGAWTSQTTLFFCSVFFLLYTVHLLDTYEDYYVRKEDQYKQFTFAHGSFGLFKENELKFGAVVSSLLFFATMILANQSIFFYGICVLGYVIGVTYSRYLSKNWIMGLLAYPIGLLLALIAANYLGSTEISTKFVIYSSSIFLFCLGAKVWMDISDIETDKRSGKKTIVNVFGIDMSRKLTLAFGILGLIFLIAFLTI